MSTSVFLPRIATTPFSISSNPAFDSAKSHFSRRNRKAGRKEQFFEKNENIKFHNAANDRLKTLPINRRKTTCCFCSRIQEFYLSGNNRNPFTISATIIFLSMHYALSSPCCFLTTKIIFQGLQDIFF